MALNRQELFERRQRRARVKLRKVSGERPRLSVFRSSKHIYAQVIDDVKGVTIAAASTLDEETKKALAKGKGCDKDAAALVGKLVAQRAKKAGVKDVVFDRGGYIYHGRVKALAEAAREAGLNF
jgi:large subunit ribosomal protein L18